MIKKTIYDILHERILVLDGGLGTMIQKAGLEEADFRGEQFSSWTQSLAGCNDILTITSPEVIRRIHEAYLMAGADIISTDSFNANALSLADYGLQKYAYDINLAAARLARSIADEITLSNPAKPRFVAGSMGPTSRTSSMSTDVSDPAARNTTFDELVDVYTDQARGLIDGGVDILLLETVFDTLNAKAGIYAIEKEFDRRGAKIPIMISGTLADASGRTLSGQTLEAFYASITHACPLTVGFNCAYGAKQLRPYLSRLAEISEYAISAHPNAGLPNVMGGYDETPEMMAADIEEYLKEGLINIIGGCCGTTPIHIAAIARIAAKYAPRPMPEKRHQTVLSGLESLTFTPESNFINIGERSNVAGSAKFARLIREQKWEEAVAVARQQVEAGAQIVDICMDDGLIDGKAAMIQFLNLAVSEPEIARVPFMIDSSSWDVLIAGLKCMQGKSIVNSISLKEGEEEFIRQAREILRYGAAVIVMLFDQTGQADTYARKIEVAKRAYEILVGIGFPPEDIVFDPNILAVATGIEQHDNYGMDFIEAVRWIKGNLPYSKVSGGVSNLSFSFRGNNSVREAMHSVFLYHAIAAGMDMGIVNPSLLQVYSEIEPELMELAEDVVLNRRDDATERLSAYAERAKESDSGKQVSDSVEQKWRSESLEERIAYAMIKGATDFIEDDILEAYEKTGSPLTVIDTMLMPTMERIGMLFGEGKMFLPQIVKSARVMKRAVGVLTPYMEQSKSGGAKSAGKVVVATVKGDVHDIGKNIVSVVMACNGYEVTDLGVMVETERIVEEARRTGADAIGLSGLISPSLDEMIKVVVELERCGLKIPVIIGGATTSDLHTAVKIAPRYSGAVVHSRDASENSTILAKLLGRESGIYVRELKEKQYALLEQFENKEIGKRQIPLAEARRNRYVKPVENIVVPARTERIVFNNFSIREVIDHIDWNFFFPAWGIRERYPEILNSPEKGAEARKLFVDATAMLEKIVSEKLLTLNGVVGIYPARQDGDDIVLMDYDGTELRLAQLRNQKVGQPNNLSLADYIAPEATDYIGVFALTAGIGLNRLTEDYRMAGDDYNAIMAKLLADRLTEAFAEILHTFTRRELWGYETENKSAHHTLKSDYQGIRVAFGYPACPDHSLKKEAFELLRATQETGMTITGNYMINPGEALCGLIFAGKEAQYFDVGQIDDEQLNDYARRREMQAKEIARLIPHNLK